MVARRILTILALSLIGWVAPATSALALTGVPPVPGKRLLTCSKVMVATLLLFVDGRGRTSRRCVERLPSWSLRRTLHPRRSLLTRKSS